MRKNRQGFRVSVYWEEFGTVNEGGIEDERYREVVRKPTAADMTWIERSLEKTLVGMGLIKRKTK